MKRFTLMLAGFLLLAGMLVALAPKADARDATTGTISGVVVNGTHHDAAVAGQKVTLQRGSGNTARDIASTTTGPDGHFSFDNVTSASGDGFAVYTQYQSGMFPSQTVKLGSDGATSLTLKVYDTTNDDANLRVTVATLLVRQPRPVNGLIGLGAVISIENTGTTAFVGTPTGDASKPMRLLRFATPPNASNLSLGFGFPGSQIFTTDKGFGATATVPPGTTDFAYSIDVPYTGTASDISYKAVYPTARILVLVPPDMFVTGKDFEAQGIINSLGSRYQVYTVANAAAGKQVRLQVTGLPQAGEKSYLDARALTILAAILALLALLALAFYLRRGNIAVALKLIPAQSTPATAPAIAQSAAPRENATAERERLLHELLALEHAHDAGKLSDREFRQRDGELRGRLRAVLASSQSAILPSARMDRATETTASTDAESAPRQESEAPAPATPEQSRGGHR